MDLSVDAIILAAGGSSRFGSPNKLLQRLPATDCEPEQTMVERVVLRAEASAAFNRIAIVVGCEEDAVRTALAGRRVVSNPDWASGMRSSLDIGLGATESGGISILLADMPFVMPMTYVRLVGAWLNDPSVIVTGAEIRPPLVLATDTAKACLAALKDPGAGLRSALKGLPRREVFIESRELLDVDRPTDLPSVPER